MENILYVAEPVMFYKSLETIKKLDQIALDIETTGLDPLVDKILLIQIGNSSVQFVFDVFLLGEDLINLLIDYLRNHNIRKIIHNAKFEYKMFKGVYGLVLENVVCTWAASTLLSKGILSAKNGLGDCLDKYLNIKVDKEMQSSFIGMKLGDKFSQEQIAYAAKDVEHLIQLFMALDSLLKSRNSEELAELEYETTRVCGDLELNGIYLDPVKWKALTKKAKVDLESARLRLNKFFVPYVRCDLFGDPVINYGSPLQLKPILEKIAGQVLESTNEKDLVRVKHPVIDALLDYREAQKKVTTYGDEFVKKYTHPVTKRIHPDFRQLGADSGRMACKNPNLQNIPSASEYRMAFTAQDTENYRIISADFSSQELALLAHISREEKFIFALNNNMDLHSYSASLIFKIPYEDFFFPEEMKEQAAEQERVSIESLTLNERGFVCDENGDPVIRKEMKKKYRNPAKSISFGLIYGMGPGKLADTLKISISEAKSLISLYFETFPKIKETLDSLVESAMANKYAYSPLDGRRRLFVGIDWDHGGKVAQLRNIAKNMPFQGAGASVTKLALCRIKHKFDASNWDAKIVNVIHDEILVSVHKDIAEEVAEIVKNEMIAAFNFYADSVPMRVKPDIETYWKH